MEQLARKRRHPELKALKGKIREEGTTYEEVAKKIGIETSTLSNKINGYVDFRAGEMEELVEILNIDPAYIVNYFFPDMLRNVI